MKKTAYILILTLILFSGKATAQCLNDLAVEITGGSTLICFNTSPGIFTAVGKGESGSYTYLWYKNDISTGVTTQTYSPGNLTANTTLYCAIMSGLCGPVNSQKTAITVVAIPAAPVIGPITQPTCTVSTGSVVLSGLPTPNDWTITITPGGATQSGNGATTTINFLSPSSYTFRVTNYAGCISPSSLPAVVQPQPSIPTPPVVGLITVPTCLVPTGSVVLSGLPATGTWTLTRLPNITVTGSGTTYTAPGLAPGIYFYTVTNQAGCTSSPSSQVTIPSPPGAPSAPIVGLITQPTCTLATGSVALSGLPASGSWTVTLSPGGRTVTGSGPTTIIAVIAPGTYTFTVTNSLSCTSAPSLVAVINAPPVTPSAPVIGTILQPTCAAAYGSVTLNSLPSGSWLLTRNPGSVTTPGSTTSITISGLDPGTYTFTVTTNAGTGCTSPSSSPVVINAVPPSPPAPISPVDCALGFNHAIINITSPLGPGYQYSLNAGPYQAAPTFTEVVNGSYFIAVRNAEGCTTVGSIFMVSCGCINAPSIVLSSIADTTCGINPVTVSNNTFTNATTVTITEDGAGSVDQSSFTVSPFTFTYTPAAGDRGRTVHITATSDNPLGMPCSVATVIFTLTVNAIPSAPSIGTVTHLTCTILTGSVVLNGLPAGGTWTITRSPDNVITSGTTGTTTVTDLVAGPYTFTVTSEEGCTSAPSVPVIINPQPESPTAPVIGTITQPVCTLSTGTVQLSGLPATGTYTLTRLPSGVTTTGSGATLAVPNVPPGTYTYTVTNAALCVSAASPSLTVNGQPPTPIPPSIGPVTSPSCTVATGSVILLGLPAAGWTVTRYPGTIETTGIGVSDTITGLTAGSTFNFTVKNLNQCISPPSGNASIPSRPVTPAPPVVGTITQPTFTVPTGSVALSGLPTGNWILTRLPDHVTTAGTGLSITVAGLSGGLYYFTVTNSVGCVSDSSAAVNISTPRPPDVIITDPAPVCSPATADLTAPGVTEGSTGGLIYTYWLDADTTQEYATPEAATAGTYYIKGTTILGYSDIKPVNVTVDLPPVANAGPDQTLSLEYSTNLEAVLGENETGIWKVESGTGMIADTTDPGSAVNNLSSGNNLMTWIVKSGACPADTDKVTIVVGDLIIPTLITPNGDSKNEYFVIMGLSSLGRSELIVFDRRGAEVFRNIDYDNKWNGVDDNENPLPSDTYFFILNSSKGRIVKGYILIRR